jgi:diguanylate cyclase (GGDEF)-like protein/PAS domain S-box-containing protein
MILLPGQRNSYFAFTVAGVKGLAQKCPLLSAGSRKKLPAMPQRLSHLTIDALSEHIAVIDASGCILTVNKAWRDFAQANGIDSALVSEGANYLEVCDRAAERGDMDAAEAAALIRAVAAGQRDAATMEYPCHAPTVLRWFNVKFTRLAGDGPLRIAAAHESITERKLAESKIRLQSYLLASVEQAVIATDMNGVIIYWNPFAEKLYGWSSSEAVGRDIIEVMASETTHEQAAQVMARLKMGESWSGEFLARHRDGSSFPIQVTNSPIRDAQGKLIGITGISTDITERKKVERALQLSAMVYQAIGEAIMVINAENDIVAVNPAFTQLTGYTEQDAVGQSTELLLSDLNGKDFYDEMRHLLEKTGHWQGRVWNRHKNREAHLEWLRIDTIYDEYGGVKHRIGMFSRITNQKLAEETIWRQANFDLLTGLPNRSMFHDRLEHEIKKASRAGLPLALMFIDLDHFKEVNDTLGHDMGDILLTEAARRLSSCIRQVDTVARLGGDEFTIIMDGLDDRGSVERVARDILTKLAEPFRLKIETVYLSASIGITLYPDDATEVDALLKNADQAMYAAKNQGRNHFNYFTPSMQHAAQARMRMVNDLRGALAGNQFQVVYQPIVELATGGIHKAEALLRWQHPVRGQVNPSDFIPIAEETGMLISIGEWVFEEALQQAARWRRTIDPEFQVSVNMSPVQFRKYYVRHGEWLDHLQNSSLPRQSAAREIVVEITEGLLLEASATVIDQLLLFRDKGIQVSIDDFGTGYSSLSYLKKFHIDYLKIDQSFVLKMKADSDDLALCEAIVVMGHKLGLKVIAEGVETKEQRDLLAAAGCDYGQGYLFSSPRSAEALDALLKNGYSA